MFHLILPQTFNLSNASNVLKTRYLGPIREQLNNSTILLSRIGREDNAVSVSGKSFTVPLHTSRNTSAGQGRDDGGTLPTAGQQGYDVAVIPNKYQYGRIQVTGPTIAATRDNAGAFLKAIDSEIQGLTMDFKKSFNRQLHGDGRDALGFLTGAVATGADTGTADDNRGNAFVYIPSGTTNLDLIDTDNATKNGDSINVTLGAKGASSYTLTWTTDLTNAGADGDYWVLEDTLGFQLMGIAGIVDDGNPALLSGGLHGLPVATKTFWVSQVVEGASAGTNEALTLERMQMPLDLIATNSDFDENAIKFLLCSYGVRAKYVSLLVADKRHVNTMELDGGFKAVDFNGIPLVPDPQCKKNRIYYLAPETLKIYRTSDFDWMEKDGAVLNRVANSDAYEATMFHYGDLGTTARNAHGLLDDITE